MNKVFVKDVTLITCLTSLLKMKQKTKKQNIFLYFFNLRSALTELQSLIRSKGYKNVIMEIVFRNLVEKHKHIRNIIYVISVYVIIRTIISH